MTSVSLKETMHCRNHPQAGASFTLALQYLTLLEMRILWHEVLSVAEAVSRGLYLVVLICFFYDPSQETRLRTRMRLSCRATIGRVVWNKRRY